MLTPSPAQLLQVWERAGEPSSATNILRLLACACGELGEDVLEALPLGRRDALLLELHARLFGEAIDGVASCPQCATVVEATFQSADLLVAQDPAPLAEASFEHISPTHDFQAHFRLPDSRDLLALESCSDPAVARALLLRRCVLDARQGAEKCPVDDLPAALQSEIAAAMADADPQADLQLAFICPGCAHAWQPPFDIARFLWRELHGWALRMLREIDALAHAYHWREADILDLSPLRRQAYLELCAS